MRKKLKPIKEYGSDFHFCTDGKWRLKESQRSPFEQDTFTLFFSGRAALYSLLEHGIKELNWEKVYFPSYYCHEVVRFVCNLPIEICYYQYNPFLCDKDSLIDVEVSNYGTTVVVNVSYFGANEADFSAIKNVVIVDDLTHNILRYESSSADYCFASLRKELPVPVGGFCYSPQGYSIPHIQANLRSEEAAFRKLVGMFLKGEYLEGLPIHKEQYRSYFVKAEDDFARGFTYAGMPDVVKAILFELDVLGILKAKSRNMKTATELSECIRQAKINLNSDNTTFGLVIECESKVKRDGLRSFLLTNNIYPAILWPNQLTIEDKSVEERIMLLHIDYRYSTVDVLTMVNAIKKYFEYE